MAQFFVDGTRPDDTGAGTAEATAKKTLAAGVALATTAGDVVNVKDSATYTLTAAVSLSVPGTAGNPITVRGYHTTPGDGAGRPTITSATNSVNLFQIAVSNLDFVHLKLTHTATTRGAGLFASGGNRSNILVDDCVFDGCSRGIDGDWSTAFTFFGLLVVNTEIKNSTLQGISNGGGTYLRGCSLHHNASDGWGFGTFTQAGQSWEFLDAERCVFAFNGRDGARMGLVGSGTGAVLSLRHCALHGNTGAGLNVVQTTTQLVLSHANNVYQSNGAGGAVLAVAPVALLNRANAYRANSSPGDRSNLTAGIGDVTPTIDPFTDAAGLDFSLNNTAGGGALLLGTGWPATLPGLAGTSYPDIGAYQSQAGSGTPRSRIHTGY